MLFFSSYEKDEDGLKYIKFSKLYERFNTNQFYFNDIPYCKKNFIVFYLAGVRYIRKLGIFEEGI